MKERKKRKEANPVPTSLLHVGLPTAPSMSLRYVDQCDSSFSTASDFRGYVLESCAGIDRSLARACEKIHDVIVYPLPSDKCYAKENRPVDDNSFAK